MKLAEALLLRSDMQKQLASIKQRIHANVLVQAGDQPSEDPKELLQQAFILTESLYELILKINKTNSVAKLSDGRDLLSCLIERDQYIEHHKILTQAIQASDKEPDRYSMREIKWEKVMPISSLQKQADDISVKLRKLNILIQENNWKIDLIES